MGVLDRVCGFIRVGWTAKKEAVKRANHLFIWGNINGTTTDTQRRTEGDH